MLTTAVMFPIALTLVILAVIGGVFVMMGLRHKQARTNWQVFAQKHGLNVKGGGGTGAPPIVQGLMGRIEVVLHTVTRGTGKNRSTFTQFRATTNAPMPAGLFLTREGFFNKVGKMFGGQDVQVGDPELDGAFIIRAQDVEGVRAMLANQHVRKALLYCVSRHPGLRVEGSNLIVEQSGVAGKLPQIDAIFQDLTYLAETLDVAYQERAQGGQAKPRPSKAAAAEVLGGGLEDSAGAGHMTCDLHRLGDALHEYEHKVESGQEHRTEQTSLQGTEESTNVNWNESFSVTGGDAFDDPQGNDAFDDPRPIEEEDAMAADEPSGDRAMRDYDPRKALADHPASADEADEADVSDMGFEDPEAEKAFENPEPFEDEEQSPPPDESAEAADAGGFDELLASLAKSGQTSGDREGLIKAHEGRSWEVELDVDRVSSTFGFSLPDGLRDGRTVEGKLPGGVKAAVLFPKGKSGEVEKLKGGEKLTVFARVAAWDDLFKKVTLYAD